VLDTTRETGLVVAAINGRAVTSACPYNKTISGYGGHNQRSCPVFPLLKRADERYVTMRAYHKPAFVEDDESIHKNQAFARIESAPTGAFCQCLE